MSTLRIQHGAPVALDGFWDNWGRKLRNTIRDIRGVFSGDKSLVDLVQYGVNQLQLTAEGAEHWAQAYSAWVRGGQQGQMPWPLGMPLPGTGGYPAYSAGIDPNTLLIAGGGALALILLMKKK